jgi:hypothetical protein
MPADEAKREDLHFESIGARDLLPARLCRSKLPTLGPYERVVEWTSPDNRSEYGQYQRNDRQAENEEAWDAILFQNPLKFPMTPRLPRSHKKGCSKAKR